MEIHKQISEVAKDYLEKNGRHYIPNFDELSQETLNHIQNISTDILLNHWDMNEYESGGFVKSIVENNLDGAFANADNINVNCIRFYVMLKHNASLN
jgi:hypothetical protein